MSLSAAATRYQEPRERNNQENAKRFTRPALEALPATVPAPPPPTATTPQSASPLRSDERIAHLAIAAAKRSVPSAEIEPPKPAANLLKPDDGGLGGPEHHHGVDLREVDDHVVESLAAEALKAYDGGHDSDLGRQDEG